MIRLRGIGGLVLLRFFVGMVSITALSQAQSLLFGPAARSAKAPVELDPRLPCGTLRMDSLSLAIPRELACSSAAPICVARGKSRPVGPRARRVAEAVVSIDVMESALAALEIAYRRLVYVARLPEPKRSWDGRLGSPAIIWDLAEPSEPLSVNLVPIAGSTFDSASVVCRSGVANAPLAEQLDRDAALCVGEAIAAGLDAGESPRSRRAYAEALWWELGQPGTADLVGIARANDTAHRASVGRDEIEQSTSTALLFAGLEQTLGTATPYGLITGLFALSAQPSRSDQPRYSNEPDWLDVLRESLGDDRDDFAQRINAIAAARAQLGSTVGPLARLAWAGTLASLKPDWELKVSSLPRRVACRHAVGPLGTTLMRVTIDVPTKDLSLALHTDWEGPVPFTWTVVKLDANDHEIGRLDFAYEPRVTSAEKRLVALDGTAALLVLGTNLGGVDATHLLDPDHAPFEPHGCTLYAVRL